MKKSLLLVMLVAGLLFSTFNSAEAQLWKKLKKKAQETAERSLENKTEEETEEGMEELLEGGEEAEEENETINEETDTDKNAARSSQSNSKTAAINDAKTTTEPPFLLYTKTDFSPGDETIFFDNFSDVNHGDFPQNWSTNYSGEIALMKSSNDKWLRLFNDTYYYPEYDFDLPKAYTVEFDMATVGMSENTDGSSYFRISFYEDITDRSGHSYARIELPLSLEANRVIHFGTYDEVSGYDLFNSVPVDLSKIIHGRNHIAISVNDTRLKLYINGEKRLDLPKLMPANANISKIEFYNDYLNENENIYITNLRVAKGKADIKQRLFTDGKFSTDAIHFDVNSYTIKPESFSVLKQIADALAAEPTKKVTIIGHTDSDGNDDNNLALSKERANSVKSALVSNFAIDDSRITTDGKGESEPLLANDSSLNKAKNRRVEFLLK